MHYVCKHCGEVIREGMKGRYSTVRTNRDAPWYCADDPSDEKRHEPEGKEA